MNDKRWIVVAVSYDADGNKTTIPAVGWHHPHGRAMSDGKQRHKVDGKNLKVTQDAKCSEYWLTAEECLAVVEGTDLHPAWVFGSGVGDGLTAIDVDVKGDPDDPWLHELYAALEGVGWYPSVSGKGRHYPFVAGKDLIDRNSHLELVSPTQPGNKIETWLPQTAGRFFVCPTPDAEFGGDLYEWDASALTTLTGLVLPEEENTARLERTDDEAAQRVLTEPTIRTAVIGDELRVFDGFSQTWARDASSLLSAVRQANRIAAQTAHPDDRGYLLGDIKSSRVSPLTKSMSSLAQDWQRDHDSRALEVVDAGSTNTIPWYVLRLQDGLLDLKTMQRLETDKAARIFALRELQAVDLTIEQATEGVSGYDPELVSHVERMFDGWMRATDADFWPALFLFPQKIYVVCHDPHGNRGKSGWQTLISNAKLGALLNANDVPWLAAASGRGDRFSIFDGMWVTQRLVMIDELMGVKDKVINADGLKQYTGNMSCTVEHKGVDRYSAQRTANLLVFSNTAPRLPLEDGPTADRLIGINPPAYDEVLRSRPWNEFHTKEASKVFIRLMLQQASEAVQRWPGRAPDYSKPEERPDWMHRSTEELKGKIRERNTELREKEETKGKKKRRAE